LVTCFGSVTSIAASFSSQESIGRERWINGLLIGVFREGTAAIGAD